ncbi:MAG: SIS domain-containing protein [Candidatus Margulisbacteria bacterium]|nr:SIS domain-containing protein [Candidatus Margulisiibacteriota bacterium]MBU1617113.1 SIS domain-containing protein [Candidatus Margulisiibacteriota bacterium]
MIESVAKGVCLNQIKGVIELDTRQYFEGFNESLKEYLEDKENIRDLLAAIEMIKSTKKRGKKIILVGNGGSSAIAEHMAIDLTKNAGLRAMAISGTPQLTTFANDYGYDKVYSKGIEAFADKGDVLIAISSGGTSKNILNAVAAARKIGCEVITFSAFEKNNPLRKKGNINIYLNSKAYGYVEIIHNLLIHYINDQIIGAAVYKFR